MHIDRPISIALILFIILLMVFFLVVPEYKTFAELQTDLGKKKAEFDAEFDYYAAITKVYDDLQIRSEEIKAVDDALPQDPTFGKLVYFLQLTAEGNGLTVKDLFLSKTSSGSVESNGEEGVRDVIFSIDLIGSYSSLESFIVSMEKSSRIFEVTNISFGSASGSQLGNFSLQIKTHSY